MIGKNVMSRKNPSKLYFWQRIHDEFFIFFLAGRSVTFFFSSLPRSLLVRPLLSGSCTVITWITRCQFIHNVYQKYQSECSSQDLIDRASIVWQIFWLKNHDIAVQCNYVGSHSSYQWLILCYGKCPTFLASNKPGKNLPFTICIFMKNVKDPLC